MTIEEALQSGLKINVLWGHRSQIARFRDRYALFYGSRIPTFVVGAHELYGYAPDRMILICLPDWESHYSEKTHDIVLMLGTAKFTIIEATESDL